MKIATILNIVMLTLILVALFFEMPYAFFQFLKIFICGACIYNVVLYHKTKFKLFLLFYIPTLIIFNPFYRLIIHKPMWRDIDLMCMIFLFMIIVIQNHIEKHDRELPERRNENGMYW